MLPTRTVWQNVAVQAPSRSRLIQLTCNLALVASLVGFLIFLVGQGLDTADKVMSIVGGLAGLLAFLGLSGHLASRWMPGPATARTVTRDSADPPSLSSALLHLREGRPSLVADLGPQPLGVKAAIKLSGDEFGMPRYVRRAGDDDLSWAIAEGGMVLLHGKAGAGKTRSAYETIRRLRPAHHLLAPSHPAALRQLIAARYPMSSVVVWLDDLERFLVPGGVDQALVQSICPPGNRDNVIVATIRDEQLARLDHALFSSSESPLERELHRDGVLLVSQLQGRRRISVGQFLSGNELDVALELADDERLAAAARSGIGFGEYLAAGPAILQRWCIGEGPLYEVGRGLIAAATDCRRAGFVGPIPQELLASLYRRYVSPGWQDRGDLPSAADGLRWASAPVLGASSCLSPVASLDAFTVSDYLVDETANGFGPLAQAEIPDLVWHSLLPLLDDRTASSVGLEAHYRDRIDVAVAAFRISATAGDVGGMLALSVALDEQRNSDEAEAWLTRAAKHGYAPAMAVLGCRLQRRDNDAEAERWYRLAAEQDEPLSMVNLGTLCERQGDRAQAEAWYRRAAEQGLWHAMHNLAQLIEPGNPDEAITWRVAAAGSGHPVPLYALGAALQERGMGELAEQSFGQAVDAGSSIAMIALGILHQERQDLEAAKIWYERAAEKGELGGKVHLGKLLISISQTPAGTKLLTDAAASGSSEAMLALASTLLEQGDIDGAEGWLASGAGADNVLCMLMLGNLLEDSRGNDLAAEAWYRRAADAGSALAMGTLGALFESNGEVAEAAHWYRRSADAGEPLAMVSMGRLLESQSDLDQAQIWYQAAANVGHTAGMASLGRLLAETGNDSDSETWLRKAAADDDVDAMLDLGVLLAANDRTLEAETWYQRAADQGSSTAATNLGILYDSRSDSDQSLHWFRLAAELGDADAMFWFASRMHWSASGLDPQLLQKSGSVGVPVDQMITSADAEQAETWYRRAADKGHPHAMNCLGTLMAQLGRTVEAIECWRTASRDGDVNARNNLERVEKL